MMERTQFPRLGETCYFERLENGLPIYVVTRPGFEKRYAFFAANYGGMDMCYQADGQRRETPAGVAHYLEHKMFDTPQGNALQMLSANGASPNAFTGPAMTGYYFECTDRFTANLRMLLSFVSTPYFTRESVEKERGIIGQEIQMVEDDPGWRLYHNLLEGLYRTHPLRVSVAGSLASIKEITAETLDDCHRAFYHPGNMALCVAGDVDPEQVAAVARMALPAGQGDEKEPPVKDYGPVEELSVAQTVVKSEMAVSAPNFLVGFKSAPHPPGEEHLRLQLLGELAGELLCGQSSPVYQRLYERGLINKRFDQSYEDYPGAAFLALGGESPAPEQVAQAMLDEGARIRREGISAERFRRCKKAVYGPRVRRLNSFDHCCVQLAQGQFNGYHYYRFPELFDSVGREETLAFLDELLRPERMTLAVVAGE